MSVWRDYIRFVGLRVECLILAGDNNRNSRKHSIVWYLICWCCRIGTSIKDQCAITEIGPIKLAKINHIVDVNYRSIAWARIPEVEAEENWKVVDEARSNMVPVCEMDCGFGQTVPWEATHATLVMITSSSAHACAMVKQEIARARNFIDHTRYTSNDSILSVYLARTS